MPVIASLYVTSIPRLVAYVLIWIILVECARILVRVYRNDPLVGWAVGPIGSVDIVFVRTVASVYFIHCSFSSNGISFCSLCWTCLPLYQARLSLPHNPTL